MYAVALVIICHTSCWLSTRLQLQVVHDRHKTRRKSLSTCGYILSSEWSCSSRMSWQIYVHWRWSVWILMSPWSNKSQWSRWYSLECLTALSATPAVIRLFYISIRLGELPQDLKIPKSHNKSVPENYIALYILTLSVKQTLQNACWKPPNWSWETLPYFSVDSLKTTLLGPRYLLLIQFPTDLCCKAEKYQCLSTYS